MFGIILASLGTFFEEVSDIIGRNEISKKRETIYTMGFLQMFWATIFFLVLVLVHNDAFKFSAASLPTFSIRVVLEIIQVYITLVAVVEADRSTFGFIRVLTIPLILLVDLAIGYQIATLQIVGIGLIILSMLILFMDHDFSKKASRLVLFTAFNSVATISLYKYNITHFNSVAAEQLIMLIILLTCLTFAAFYITKEHPFKMLGKKVFFLQSFAQGVGSLIESFAYSFAAASIIISAKRSSSVFWATLSGGLYFKERHILVKLSMFLLLTAGIVLIIV